MANDTDPVPGGFVDGSYLVHCPDGCNSEWTYSEQTGFVAPPVQELATKVEF